MHIAIDAINFNDHVRGPDRYLIGLLEGLAKLSEAARYTVFYAPWQRHFETLALPPNFEFIRCHPPHQRSLRLLWHAIFFPRIARSVNPDILHLPNLIYVPRIGVPVVMTVHDLAHYRYPEKFGRVRSGLLRWLLHRTVANADFAIAVSEYTRNDILRFLKYPGKRIRVIAEGGPCPMEPASLTTSHTLYFLYVGQLELTKNIETLIYAFLASSLFKEQGVELWIAGRMGNAASAIRHALASSNHDGRVRLLGYVDDHKLPLLYAGCQAFVFPSLIEGFGLVLLEAMAYGAPVIAANASVIPEVVGDGGLLVDATDASAIRMAMETVHASPGLRSELRTRGRNRLGAFSWHKAATDTWQVYKEARAISPTSTDASKDVI